jgi:tetratricopeptide (TPR) repeat protein
LANFYEKKTIQGKLILEMGDLKLAAFCVQHAAFLNEGKIAESSTSLQVSNNRDQSFTQQAVVYSFLKSFPKAINVLNVELRSKPDTKTFNLLAKIQMEAKNWEDACVTLQKSIDFNVACSLTENAKNFIYFKNLFS